jgi:hypothetical protein
VSWHGELDDWQLRDRHRHGQCGYDRNRAAPHFRLFLERFDRQPEHIADVTLSLDYARCTGIDLQFAPQPSQDLDIDCVYRQLKRGLAVM